jgi:hypothetical protein
VQTEEGDMGMWSGPTGQQFAKYTRPTKRPRFLIPSGTKVAVRNVITDEWRTYTTTKENGFEKYDRYERNADGAFYEFRTGLWVLIVHRRYVIHRDDIDTLEQRLRRVAGR